MMARLIGSTAVLLVADIDRAATYYGEMLGFECHVFGESNDAPTAFASLASPTPMDTTSRSDSGWTAEPPVLTRGVAAMIIADPQRASWCAIPMALPGLEPGRDGL